MTDCMLKCLRPNMIDRVLYKYFCYIMFMHCFYHIFHIVSPQAVWSIQIQDSESLRAYLVILLQMAWI